MSATQTITQTQQATAAGGARAKSISKSARAGIKLQPSAMHNLPGAQKKMLSIGEKNAVFLTAAVEKVMRLFLSEIKAHQIHRGGGGEGESRPRLTTQHLHDALSRLDCVLGRFKITEKSFVLAGTKPAPHLTDERLVRQIVAQLEAEGGAKSSKKKKKRAQKKAAPAADEGGAKKKRKRQAADGEAEAPARKKRKRQETTA